MPQHPAAESLLDQLDALQDQVLRDLDVLDGRILALIQKCVQTDGLAAPVPTTPAPVSSQTKEAA
jgi:hypothetical protein